MKTSDVGALWVWIGRLIASLRPAGAKLKRVKIAPDRYRKLVDEQRRRSAWVWSGDGFGNEVIYSGEYPPNFLLCGVPVVPRGPDADLGLPQ